MPKRHDTSPVTIGLLLENLSDSRFADVWQGVADVARQQGMNLRCFCTGSLQNAEWMASNKQRVLCRLIHAHELDGLLTFQWWRKKAWFESLCRTYSPLPIVNIMRHFDGYPGIRIDNKQGVRDQLQHAIEVHGCRKIAYMPGADSPSSRERFQAYQETLRYYDIPFDSTLVIPRLNSSDSEAAHARSGMRLLLNTRKLRPGKDVDAIATFNDAMAFGAIDELQSLGIHVPYEIAVIGFNNQKEADFSTIPLTTIDVPWYHLGKQAANMLLEWVDSGVSPGHRLVSPTLIVRRSCGCHEPEILHAGLTLQTSAPTSRPGRLESIRSVMTESLKHLIPLECSQLQSWDEQLVEAFLGELGLADVEPTESGEFLRIFEHGLRQMAETRENLDIGQELLSTLTYEFWRCAHAGPETWQQASVLGQQGRILVHKLAQRTQRRRQAENERLAMIVREIGQRLITTFDVDGLMDVLAEELPRLGMTSCYLSLYEDPNTPDGEASLILGYNGHDRLPLPPEKLRFPAQQLVPHSVSPMKSGQNFVIEALFFGEQQIGFVLFGNGPRDGKLYQILRAEISSALQGALLVQELQQYRDHLEDLVDQRTTQLRRSNEQLHQSIRERTKAEQALRSSEQQYRLLAEHVKDGILIIQHGKIVFSNTVLATMLGVSPESLLGNESAGLFHFTDIVEQAGFDELRSALPGNIRQALVTTVTDRELWTEIESTPILWNSQDALLLTVRNITSRKLKERQLEEERARLHQENITLRSTIKERFRFGSLIGKSPAMQQVYGLIMSAATSDVNVLVVGESGTGKELIARTIHQVSSRREQAFVAVNCASIPETLFEREFFGHRRGAFTGAERDKPGFFDRAHQGVLFLDEVTELTPGTQAKLLRVLQDGEYTPLGVNVPKQADVLIVAATNKNPQEEIEQKRLRSDFFYRICVIEITLPPLRNRKDDLALLVEHFLEQYRAKYAQKHGNAPEQLPYNQSGLPGELLQALYTYSWPGNVRELQNILQRYLATQDLASVLSLMSVARKRAATDIPIAETERQTLSEIIQTVEKRVISESLARHDYHVEAVAEQLHINARTLYRKIKQYNLWKEKYSS